MHTFLFSHDSAKKFRYYDPNEPEPVFDPPFRVVMDVVVDEHTRGEVVMEIVPQWAVSDYDESVGI
jgi:hypothetical protein